MSEDKTRLSADQSEHYVALAPGFVLGKYRLDGVLGQGGFGITYKAWDTSLNRAVAIKEYLPADVAIRVDGTTVSARSRNDADNFQWGLQRFLEEARSLARFEDAPSIVRVYDYLQANGTAYMAMALVDGTALSAIYRREAPLSEARLKAIVLPLLEGLQHVHQAGFLHRDIKPSNILIRADGKPVLIDFGAARQAFGEKSRSITSVFTPGYAPFEQYSSTGRQGPWTDIYALAATLHHGITGQLPVSAADRIPEDPMVPASKAGAGKYSKAFLAAIDHGLGVFEADRPQDVSQWARMLRGEIAVPPPRAKPQPVAPPWNGRKWVLRAGGIGAAIAIAVAGAALMPDVVRVFSSETPEARAQRLAEQAKLATAEAQRAQQVVEAEARRRAEEEARLKAEADARLRAQEEAKRQAAEAQRRIEEAARTRDEEAKRKAEEEAARLAEEQRQRQRLIDEQVAVRRAAEEARKKAEAELAEAQRQAEEAQKQAAAARAAADAELKRQAEAEARRKTEAEAKAKADAETKAKAEADAKRKAEEEARAKSQNVTSMPPPPASAPTDPAAYVRQHWPTLKFAVDTAASSHLLNQGLRLASVDGYDVMEVSPARVVLRVRVTETTYQNSAQAAAPRRAATLVLAFQNRPPVFPFIGEQSATAAAAPPPAPVEPAAYVAQHWPTLRPVAESAASTAMLNRGLRLTSLDGYEVVEVGKERIVLRLKISETSTYGPSLARPRTIVMAFQNQPPNFPFIAEQGGGAPAAAPAPAPTPNPAPAPQVAARPAYPYAGNWTWSIACPNVNRDRFFAYWKFERIESPSFNWSFGGANVKGTASGTITGNRMSFRQEWRSDDGNNFRADFSLTASDEDNFAGNGIVSGFPGGGTDRPCTIKMLKV